MSNKEIILSFTQYISEKKSPIIRALANNKRVLLYAPMRGGKSHLIYNDLAPAYNAQEVRVFTVSPVTLLIEQQNKRADSETWGSYYGGQHCSLDTFNIVTTPDSLPKIVEASEEKKGKFLLVIDESHEEESSRGFRESFKNIEAAANSAYCEGVLYLTATPQHLERGSLDKFDKYIRLEQDLTLIGQDGKEEPNPHIFKHAKELIVKPIVLSTENIIKTIESELRLNPGNPVLFKLDNKAKLKEIDSYFSSKGGADFKFLASNLKYSDYKPHQEEYEAKTQQLREAITNYKELIGAPGEIIGFTSLINSGIEVNNNPSACFINFTNGTYNHINEIQSIGRFRNGVNRIILTIPPEQETAEPSVIKKYEEVHEQELRAVLASKSYLDALITIGDKERIDSVLNTEPALSITPEGAVLVDTIQVRAQSNKKYEAQFKASPALFLEHFKRESGLNIDAYKIEVDEPGLEPESEESLRNIKDLKEIAAQHLEEREEFVRRELTLASDNLLEAIAAGDPRELKDSEVCLLETLEELYEAKPAIEKTIKELRACNLSGAEALRLYGSKGKKEINTIIRAYKLSLYNRSYKDNKAELINLSLKGRKPEREELKRLIATLDYLLVTKGIKHGDRISKADIIELIKIYSKLELKPYIAYMEALDGTDKKAIKKAQERALKDLRDYLSILLKININNSNIRYSSLRVDIKDLIRLND